MEPHPNIDHFVSELLFRHDCVIVPGLGGFVGNYAPARIHPTQHTFSPPSKLLVFNRNLQHNDGLLAQEIATALACSFDEAAALIRTFAEECAQQLKVGRKVELKNVGTLYYDVERNLQFEPDTSVNYLVDAFGLSAFQSMPVKRETYTERREVRTEDRRERAKPNAEETARIRRRRRRMVAMAIAAPFLLAAIWIPVKTDFLKSGQLADLNPFRKKMPALYSARPVTISTSDHKAFVIAPEKFEADSNGLAQVQLTDAGLPLVVQVAEAESTAVAKTTKRSKGSSPNAGTYYVIGGCFSVPANADNFLRRLEEKGYEAELLVNPKKSNLLHVSFGSFLSRSEAESMLSRISAEHPGAWILKK